MTTTYDPAECARLCREAKEDDAEYRTCDGIRYTTSVMAARQRDREHLLADQLEAAGALVDLRGETVADLANELGSVKAQRDKLQAELEAARREVERLTVELAKPIDRRPICDDTSPRWFTGHWREWHRGHGCDKDDGIPRSPYATAEIDAYRAARDKAGG